jgi:hypothetical protein
LNENCKPELAERIADRIKYYSYFRIHHGAQPRLLTVQAVPVKKVAEFICVGPVLQLVFLLIPGKGLSGYSLSHWQTQRKLQTQSYRPYPGTSGRAAELLREIVHFATGSVVSFFP